MEKDYTHSAQGIMFDFHSGLIRHTTVKMNVTGRSFMR